MTASRQAKRETSDRTVGDRNRARILEAAVEVFAIRGYDGARIAEIAERSQLPKANVYYYFRTKRAIYETIIGNLVRDWDAALAQLDAARRPGGSAFKLYPRQVGVLPQAHGSIEDVRQ